MINLILAIVSSMLVSVTMRASERRAKNNISMLAMNYLMCTLLSAAFAGTAEIFPAQEGLGAALLLGAIPVQAVDGSMDHFTRDRSYDGRFTDVTEDRWYYNNIASLYELGLTDGQSADFYGAASPLKLSEALSFAARIHSTYYLGDPEAGAQQFAGQLGHWYTPYILYLQANGVIADQFAALYDTNATRAQTAFFLSSLLPEQEFSPINNTAVTVGYATRLFITDVDDYTIYQQEILRLLKRVDEEDYATLREILEQRVEFSRQSIHRFLAEVSASDMQKLYMK